MRLKGLLILKKLLGVKSQMTEWPLLASHCDVNKNRLAKVMRMKRKLNKKKFLEADILKDFLNKFDKDEQVGKMEAASS